jgi:thiamine biosynthesis lipoprotein
MQTKSQPRSEAVANAEYAGEFTSPKSSRVAHSDESSFQSERTTCLPRHVEHDVYVAITLRVMRHRSGRDLRPSASTTVAVSNNSHTHRAVPPANSPLRPAKSMILVGLILTGLILTGLVPEAHAQSQPNVVSLSGNTMGTTWSVKAIAATAGAVPQDSWFTDELATINAAMSTWDPDSEISQFNTSESTDWFAVSARTAKVVTESIRIAQLTDGAFDPTVGPLIDLWNFGSRPAEFRVPTDEQIVAVRDYVGFNKLHVREDPPAIRKDHPQLSINLSAIAKGYAVDAVADVMRSNNGPRRFLIEIGGEIVARGKSSTGKPWRIGIEEPVSGRRDVYKSDGKQFVVALSNLAMATSGDYRNYFEAQGIRYSHTIDPKTGRPVNHDLVSVTVLHKSCMTADALATALLVLGPDDGYNLAQQQQLAVLMLTRRDGRIVEKRTASFPGRVPTSTAAISFKASTMRTFLIAAIVFLLAIAGMAIGVILSNRRLQGSCGGLSSMQNGDTKPMCELCSVPPEECDTFRKAITSDDNPKVEA